MSTLEVSPAESLPEQPNHSVINDFSIQVATVNGSGSQTANTVLMRAIFQMGIPVSGKNMFPSNIAGLPTWFTIRASKHGYIGRRKEIDFLVAMNPETAREDVMKLDSGAAVVYDEPLKLNELRSDLHFFPVPFDKLVAPVCPEAKLRKLVRNMIYDGVVAQLLSIEMEEIHKALFKQFGKKKAKAAELNWGACQAGFDYATKTFTQPLRFKVERMNETAGKIIIDGNAACALGCMFAGCTVVTWYPDYAFLVAGRNHDRLHEALPHRSRNRQGDLRHRAGRRRTGLHRHGARRRMGGRPLHDRHRRTRHLADERVHRPRLLRRDSRRRLRRGTRRPLHRPAHPHRAERPAHHRAALPRRYQAPHVLPRARREECFSMSIEAFEFAEKFQTPDLRHDRSRSRHEQLDGGRVRLSRKAHHPRQGARPPKISKSSAASPATGMWMAMASATAPCPAPTIPTRPTSRAAAATTKRPSTPSAKTITSTTWIAWRTSSKSCASIVPEPVIAGRRRRQDRLHRHSAPPTTRCAKAAISCATNTRSPSATCASRRIPFTEHLLDFIRRHDRVYVVDQNRDAQLLGLMRLELDADLIAKLRSVRYYGGLPLDARTVTDDIVKQEGK